MAYISWTTDYSVGDSEMDSQHQKLFRMLSDFHAALLASNREESLKKTIHDLIGYTHTHFSAEERLMQEIGYPDLAAHKQAHGELVRKVMEMDARLRKGEQIAGDMLEFLVDWLTKHIMGMDKKYAVYAQKRVK
jgi:hemerythrin